MKSLSDKVFLAINVQLILLFCILLVPDRSLAHRHPAYSHDSIIALSYPDWMGWLSDDLRISELSIPGTHDTMSKCGTDIVECQSLKLEQQLNAGIRVLDIRARRIWNHFDITHGCNQQGDNCWNLLIEHYEFDDVLCRTANFLDDNPTETVIMRVQDAGCPIDPQRSFLETFLDYIENQECIINGQPVFAKNYIWTVNSNNSSGICNDDFMTVCADDSECQGECLDRSPTLGEVRGKIVILRNFGGAEMYGLQWGTDLYDIQDWYNFGTNWDLDDKWFKVLDQLQETNYGFSEKIYINFLTGSGGSFPYFVASGHSSPRTSAPRLWTGYCGGCSYYQHKNWVGCCYFEGINMLTYAYRLWQNPQRMGIIMMDFPGPALIQQVISVNFTNQPPAADAKGPYVVSEGIAVNFDGSASTDADDDPLQYRWDFENDLLWDTSWLSNPFATFVWYDDHTGDASLEVTDGGLNSFDVAEVKVLNASPVVYVGPDSFIYSGQTFTVSAGFTDPGINDMPWNFTVDWDKGLKTDGTTDMQGAGTIVYSHKYLGIDNYTIIVSVTDKDGGGSSDSMNLQVKPLPVVVDIKPGSARNSINPKSKGKVPVALVSGTYEGVLFDAVTVDLNSVKFGPDGALKAHTKGHLKDADGDGDLDLVLHFKTQEIGIACGDTEIFLSGETHEGIYFMGMDNIQTPGCKKK